MTTQAQPISTRRPIRVTPRPYGAHVGSNTSYRRPMSQETNAMSMTVSHRTRLHIILVTVAVAFVLLLVTATRAFASGGASDIAPAPAATVDHLVEPGDTLWEIASEHAAPGDDIRRAVFEIQQVNGLPSSVIIPGQVLVVPVG